MNSVLNPSIIIKDFHKISYKRAWDIQLKHQAYLMEIKLANRLLDAPSKHQITPNYLLFCEHNPVYTLGKNGKIQNVLLNEEELAKKGIEFYHIERGGDVTYHGPGQLTVYPILDLENFFTDLHLYLRKLENVVKKVIAHYGIKGELIEGLTGVWIIDHDKPNSRPRKIAAMGVKCSRWITLHGFALNINNDLNYFKEIIPCNIPDKEVTSIQKETNQKIDLEETKLLICNAFLEEFGAVRV